MKREAEADSEANSEADAESWYYGFGYPSAFQQQGYSGYPYYNHLSAYPTAYKHAMTARFVQPYNGQFVQHYNRYIHYHKS